MATVHTSQIKVGGQRGSIRTQRSASSLISASERIRFKIIMHRVCQASASAILFKVSYYHKRCKAPRFRPITPAMSIARFLDSHLVRAVIQSPIYRCRPIHRIFSDSTHDCHRSRRMTTDHQYFNIRIHDSTPPVAGQYEVLSCCWATPPTTREFHSQVCA